MLRDLVWRGVTPAAVAELTPHQAWAVLFREAADVPAGDPKDPAFRLAVTHRANHERAGRGEPPVVPHYLFGYLPVVQRDFHGRKI